MTLLYPVTDKAFRLLLANWPGTQVVHCPLKVFTNCSAWTQPWDIMSDPPQGSGTSGLSLMLTSKLLRPLVKRLRGWVRTCLGFLAEESFLQQGKKQQVSFASLVTFSALKNGRKCPGTC